MSDYNQLRSSLIDRLKRSEPKILRRLEEIEELSSKTRPEIEKVYNDIALNVLKRLLDETNRHWSYNEDKQRILLAGLILTDENFLDHDVTNPHMVSVSDALTTVISRMLEDEAYEWFYDFAYNFQQNRHNKTGSAA